MNSKHKVIYIMLIWWSFFHGNNWWTIGISEASIFQNICQCWMKNRMWWLNEAKIIISDQIVKYTILFWHLLNELNNLYIMLKISTPIITKADLIEGSIINCVQCDIQIYIWMKLKYEWPDLKWRVLGLICHFMVQITIDCICLLGSVTLYMHSLKWDPFILHLLFVEIGMKVRRCYQKLQRLDFNLRKRLGP